MSIPKDVPGQKDILAIEPAPMGEEGADGSYEVASLAGPAARQFTTKLARDILEPLTQPGARVSDDVQITKPTEKRPTDADVTVTDKVQTPAEPRVETEEQPRISPEPVTEEIADQVVADRAAMISSERQAPSPTPKQKAEGVQEGRINTTFYSDDELTATINAVSKDLPPVAPKSIQGIFDDALNIGIPKQVLDQIFKGKPMTSAVGGDDLAKNMASLITIHDASLVKVDGLMARAAKGQLDTQEKVALREALAQHDIILQRLTSAKTDVARTMNVFKGAGDGTAKTLSVMDQQRVLDSFGGDDQLRVLAQKWVTAPDTKTKNKFLKVGLLRRSVDAMIFTAQSTLLTDPNTHLFNAAGTAAIIGQDTIERAGSIAVGPIRQKLADVLGKQAVPDRYKLADLYARTSGVLNGILDGVRMMGAGLTQKGEVQAKDVPRQALSAEYFSNAPILSLRNDAKRTGDLKGTGIGMALDGAGMLHSAPMRLIAASDGFFGGVAQRMELHEQAARHGANIYFDALEEGLDPGVALERAQHAAGKMLTEQPADVAASVQGFRRMATLQQDIDRETFPSPLYTAASRALNARPIRMITLFNKTLMNIADQGFARTPVAPIVSPQFWTDWNKGGKHRDLAISRVGVGSMYIAGGYTLAEMGRITGPGPKDPRDRDTLTAQGWMPFSMQIMPDEKPIPTALQRKITEVLGDDSISFGTGDFKDRTFVSFKKLEPVSIPLMLGAAAREALHFSEYDDDSAAEKFMAAAAGTMYQMAGNFPQMQILSEFYRVAATQKNTEDSVGAMGRALDVIVGTYANTVISGTPVAGLSNGALSARLERYIDPGQSETGLRTEQIEYAEAIGVDLEMPGLRAAGEAYNRWMSRTPYWSKELPARLNEYGEEIIPDLNMLYHFGPRIRGGVSSRASQKNDLKAFMSAINHGLPRVQKSLSFDGVQLTSDVRIKYIQLYANDIRLEGMNMTEAMLKKANELLDDAKLLGQFPYGEAQKEMGRILGQYKTAAKERMFGKMVTDNQYRIVSVQPVAGDKLGLPGDVIEYPELAREMRRNRNQGIFEPK